MPPKKTVPPPELDLSPSVSNVNTVVNVNTRRVKTVRTKDPWVAMSALFDQYAYDVQNGWVTSGKIRARYDKSHAVFDVELFQTFNGLIKHANMRTRVVKPDAPDPEGAYEYALHVTFDRPAVDPKSCSATIDYISAKPQHGVETGTDAIGMALSLCKLIGCSGIKLYDGSTLYCEKNNTGSSSDHANVSLRALRVLIKGNGWYESKGFKSLLEHLDPQAHKRRLAQIPNIDMDKFIQYLSGADKVLRQAFLNRKYAGVRLASYDKSREEPKIIEVCETNDITDALASVCIAYDILTKSRATRPKLKTLGPTVDAISRANCKDAANLTRAFFPNNRLLIVLSTKGHPVPIMPAIHAWVYTWRLLDSFTELTITKSVGKKMN